MFSKGSVLVVDDEVNLCRILGAKLAKSGYSVVAVHDGQQAIDKVRESDFDVVLLDLILPKVDGLSALAQIRGMKQDLPVIVMTACGSAEALETAKSHGVSAYVNKPFDLDDIVELIQNTSAASTIRKSRGMSNGTILFTRDQPIVLEVLNGKTSGIFASIIDSKDERTLCILSPVRDGSVLEVPPRTPVRVGLGANDAYYSFNSYVLTNRPGDIPILVLDKPGVIYRTQRRRDQRIAVETPVRYARVADEDVTPDQLAGAVSVDLGVGGIRIITVERLEPGDLVYLEADAAAGLGPITAFAEVLRIRPVEREPRFAVAMRFKRVSGNLGALVVE